MNFEKNAWRKTVLTVAAAVLVFFCVGSALAQQGSSVSSSAASPSEKPGRRVIGAQGPAEENPGGQAGTDVSRGNPKRLA